MLWAEREFQPGNLFLNSAAQVLPRSGGQNVHYRSFQVQQRVGLAACFFINPPSLVGLASRAMYGTMDRRIADALKVIMLRRVRWLQAGGASLAAR